MKAVGMAQQKDKKINEQYKPGRGRMLRQDKYNKKQAVNVNQLSTYQSYGVDGH